MSMSCLFMVGQHDHGGELAQQANTGLPHADLVILSGLGHPMCRAAVGLPSVRAFFDRVGHGALTAASS
jgi:hypothetical protein